MNDPFALERFVKAQNPVYENVLAELRNGRKTSHWMWFVFPQVSGLGSSPMAEKYAISSLEEATAYLDHPVLGPRLWECCEILMTTEGSSAEDIFGYPDVLKLRSSMTLFSKAAPAPNIFGGILEKYYGGEPDPGTLPRIR
ncbi:DUF1810 domain-containing protein [Rhizobium sp. S95]|uniref:DUF1810 domain-containing protein n=1 Tax=Ciceribacter sichuanensis TaxID=2949647 RepID=A0AAJ1F6V0_9HYPH|nr:MULTISPECIES: DUF1810 domain-containing protein [unclassified Ciceribacter]MCM2399270.1 DUF1810 domain-containing protein [Ciceribacter sp. S95]MCM2401771.1 DUF1810 domain-containing protein [Ciceribacter sp. S153]MCO5956524.1 DUF1810 domain-containing protein [Ciceribacter sp. S101]